MNIIYKHLLNYLWVGIFIIQNLHSFLVYTLKVENKWKVTYQGNMRYSDIIPPTEYVIDDF